MSRPGTFPGPAGIIHWRGTHLKAGSCIERVLRGAINDGQDGPQEVDRDDNGPAFSDFGKAGR